MNNSIIYKPNVIDKSACYVESGDTPWIPNITDYSNHDTLTYEKQCNYINDKLEATTNAQLLTKEDLKHCSSQSPHQLIHEKTSYNSHILL